MRNGFLRARGLRLGHPRRRHPGAWSPPAWWSATPTPPASRSRRSLGLGLDGVTFNMPANGHDPDAVAHTVRCDRRPAIG